MNSTPKTSRTPRRLRWHPEDIKAAVRKRGKTLRALAIENGLHKDSIAQALRRPWPRAERVIADFLGVPPEDIWPDRYNRDYFG